MTVYRDIQPDDTSENWSIFQTPVISTPIQVTNSNTTCMEVQTSPVLQDKSDSSFAHTLQRSLMSPLSVTEERIHTHMTKRKLNFSKDKTLIACKTGGQPILFWKVTKAKKMSEFAKSPLKLKRARDMSSVRTLISGIEKNHQTFSRPQNISPYQWILN